MKEGVPSRLGGASCGALRGEPDRCEGDPAGEASGNGEQR